MAIGDEPAEQVLAAPADLGDLTEGVVIPLPPELHASPLPPLTSIHASAYRYLFVPDEVALVSRAARAPAGRDRQERGRWHDRHRSRASAWRSAAPGGRPA
jgi:hypothetical protein